MKRTITTGFTRANLTKYAFVIGSGAALIGRAGAQTAALFSFESSYSSGAGGTAGGSTGAVSGPLTAEVGLGTAIGVHAAATTVYSFPAGFNSVRSFSSNVWAAGDYYQFSINATGFTSAIISFDMARSSTGPNGFTLQYSSNGGTTFSNFTTFSASSVAFSTGVASPSNVYNFDLSGISALSNNATDVFRLTADGTNSTGGVVASGGTARVDNFQFGPAQPVVPEPSTIALLSIAGAGAVMTAVRRRRA